MFCIEYIRDVLAAGDSNSIDANENERDLCDLAQWVVESSPHEDSEGNCDARIVYLYFSIMGRSDPEKQIKEVCRLEEFKKDFKGGLIAEQKGHHYSFPYKSPVKDLCFKVLQSHHSKTDSVPGEPPLTFPVDLTQRNSILKSIERVLAIQKWRYKF